MLDMQTLSERFNTWAREGGTSVESLRTADYYSPLSAALGFDDYFLCPRIENRNANALPNPVFRNTSLNVFDVRHLVTSR